MFSKIKKQSRGLSLFPAFAFFILLFSTSSCKLYKFNDVSIPPDIKTVNLRFVENRARIVNPQLSPRLTDRLRQKIVSQTRLTQVNSDSVDYDIAAEIRDYSVITTGVSDNPGTGRQQPSSNRLTVSVHIVRTNQRDNTVKEYDVSRSFDFSSGVSLQQAEANLLDDMVRNLADEIFNQIFSEW